MARVPGKMIERLLKKEGIEVDGYDVLDCLSTEAIQVAKEQGMDDGITEEYDFTGTLEYENFILTFECSMVEDYRDLNGEEIPYYYLHVDNCKIERNGMKDKVIDIGVYQN
ncbi:MAG: hypothetical protein P4L59_09865 [Desulfosporosinus sp.]|nr:hypothetical protein [Desulfosporosinus sp.]